MERIPGLEPRTSTLARLRSATELHPHGALPRCRTGRPVHTKDECAPARRASFRELDSNQRAPVSRTGRDASNPSRIAEPSLSADLSEPPLQGTAGHRPGGRRALGGSRTLTALADHTALSRARLPFRHEHIEPLDGLEPPASPYEGDALPGELQRHRSRSRTRTSIPRTRTSCPAIRRTGNGAGGGTCTRIAARFELARSALPSLPRAPPRSRTLCPPGKSRVLHLYSSRRVDRPRESNPHHQHGRLRPWPLDEGRMVWRVVPARTLEFAPGLPVGVETRGS